MKIAFLQKRIVELIDLHLESLGQNKSEVILGDELDGFDMGEYI